MINKDKLKVLALKFEAQAAMYAELTETAKVQAEQLEAKDIRLFEKATAKQEELINAIAVLEKEKQVLFGELSTAAGYNEGDSVTLESLAPQMDPDSAAVMKSAVMKLVASVKDAETANAKNMRAVKNYIDYAKHAEEKKAVSGKETAKNNFDKTV